MNETNDRIKIDISGSLHDAANQAATEIVGIFIVAVMAGILFAPLAFGCIESQLRETHRHLPHQVRHTVVKAKMVKAKAVLWTISLIGWAVVLGTFFAYKMS